MFSEALNVLLSEMSEISAFKNYIEGEPTCRLYIKNLAKHVDEKVVEGLVCSVARILL